MRINEIFCSINGESSRSGMRTVFIRAHGCSIFCNYCDSLYAVQGNEYTNMTVDEIIREVEKYDCRRVTLTGGEPLIQSDALELIDELCKRQYAVEIETNGAVDLAELINKREHISTMGVSGYDSLLITMDWKCPGSGMHSKMIESNLSILDFDDVVKCVVSDKVDLDEMAEICKRTDAMVYVSPVFGRIEPRKIAEYLIDNKINDVVLQLQIHKIIWDPNMRGV